MLGGLGVTPLYTYENRASVLISWRLPACRAWRVPKDGRAHGPHPLPFVPPRAAGEGQPLAGWRVLVDPLRALGCLPRAELTGACLVRSGTAPAVGNSPTFVLVCPAPPAVLSQGWPSPPGPGQLPAGGESPARCLPAPRGPPSAPCPMQVLTCRSCSDVNCGVLWGTQGGSRVASGRFGLPACRAGVRGPAAQPSSSHGAFPGLLGSPRLARPRSPALGLLRLWEGAWGELGLCLGAVPLPGCGPRALLGAGCPILGTLLYGDASAHCGAFRGVSGRGGRSCKWGRALLGLRVVERLRRGAVPSTGPPDTRGNVKAARVAFQQVVQRAVLGGRQTSGKKLNEMPR